MPDEAAFRTAQGGWRVRLLQRLWLVQERCSRDSARGVGEYRSTMQQVLGDIPERRGIGDRDLAAIDLEQAAVLETA